MIRTTFRLTALVTVATTATIAAAQPTATRPAPVRPPSGGGGAPLPGGGGHNIMAPPPQIPQPKPMPAPVPAKELVDAGKAMKGTWRCRGFLSYPDGSSTPTTGTMKIAMDLDGFWLTSDYVEAKSKAPVMPHPTHLRMARTFDATSRTWTAISLANNGGSQLLTSTDVASPMTWTGSLAMGSMKVATRDHEEYDAKTRVNHIWGEFSLDGTSFLKTYDLHCHK